VTHADGGSISVSYSEGIIRVPFENLSDELRTKFKMTAETAASFTAQEVKVNAEQRKAAELRAKAEQAHLQLDKAAIPVMGTVIQVVPGGAIVNLRQVKAIWIEDKKTVKHPPTLLGSSGLPDRVIDRSHWSETTTDLGTAFVDVEGLVDDQDWRGTVWREGAYSYLNLLNYQRTIPKFTVDKLKAAADLGVSSAVPSAVSPVAPPAVLPVPGLNAVPPAASPAIPGLNQPLNATRN
jgi:hypothetical protein